jgi:hypothetical protein
LTLAGNEPLWSNGTLYENANFGRGGFTGFAFFCGRQTRMLQMRGAGA